MTPLQIKMMLHYYCSPTPYAKYEPHHAHSEAVFDQRANLMDEGLLVPVDSAMASYECTEKGKAYVSALCAMPLPIAKWVIPECGEAA